jgi:hypothetical protein
MKIDKKLIDQLLLLTGYKKPEKVVVQGETQCSFEKSSRS